MFVHNFTVAALVPAHFSPYVAGTEVRPPSRPRTRQVAPADSTSLESVGHAYPC